MKTLTYTIETALRPEQVLAAAHDFTERRRQIFPAVEDERLVVHAIGADRADVTEGTGTGIGVNWERCDYDWSDPRSVTATVTDSNVYASGSLWRISASPAGAGARVEMSWVRRFKRTPRAVLFGTAFRLIGRRIFRKYANQIVANLESLVATSERANEEDATVARVHSQNPRCL